MKSNFKDSSIIIQYIQQMLSETYNSSVKINKKYYETFDMNYGLAHYIAKYLDCMYPVLDPIAKSEYESSQKTERRSITDTISVMNYFLCDNKGNKLSYSPMLVSKHDSYENLYKKYNSSQYSPYNKIYNQYMVIFDYFDDDLTRIEPINDQYFNKKDPPLFLSCEKENGKYVYKADDNVIFRLGNWEKDKDICEIDNFIGSYLLGRTIGPHSSMEDIYYAQKLLIHDRNIEQFEKGLWCPKTDPNGIPCEGSIYDMTQTVLNYQKKIVQNSITNNYNIFVTGYFDIFTEAYAIKEVGVRSNGILGL